MLNINPTKSKDSPKVFNTLIFQNNLDMLFPDKSNWVRKMDLNATAK